MTDGRSWIFSPPGFKFGPFCAEQSILDVFSPAIAMFAPTSSFSAAVQVRDLRDAAVPSRLCGRVGAGHHHLRHAAVMCGSARGAAGLAEVLRAWVGRACSAPVAAHCLATHSAKCGPFCQTDAVACGAAAHHLYFLTAFRCRSLTFHCHAEHDAGDPHG